MNIFILDEDLRKSAIYHVDKHCVKMILEHAQMLCTSLIVNGNLRNQLNIETVPYKKSHMNHPCTIWVSNNYENFAWLVAYTHELHEEYKYRYNKEHLSYTTLVAHNIITTKLIQHGNALSISELNPQCVMPDECKKDTVIESYRNYYRLHKRELFKWTKREIPNWVYI